MECQNIAKNLKINKNKTIGEVVIVVEGESEEFKLLKHIFVDILDYNYIPLKRNKIMKESFQSKNNKNSTIIIANTSSSNIKTLIEDDSYKDKLYELLINDYNKSLKNVPIYILWDRDNKSNKKDIVLKSLKTFGSSMDNEYEMNGLLLLSYPCIESYELSNFNKQLWKKKFETSNIAKKFLKELQYSMKRINEKTLLLAVENMHRTFKEFEIFEYDTFVFKKVNNNIFNKEEDNYSINKNYKALSLISIMLIDLGIIQEK